MAVLFLLITLLVIPFVSASFFDWITGRATEEIEIIKEQVKCVFVNANSEQKCYSGQKSPDPIESGLVLQAYSCLGVESCTVEVSGPRGYVLFWESSCGGYTETVIDGANDYVEFKCEETQATTTTSEPAPTTTEITRDY